MNPVVTTLSIFTALFGGGAIWGFLSAFVNRKADLKESESRSSSAFEKIGTELRAEIRNENVGLKADIRDMKLAFIPLITVLDGLLPKMVNCLTEEEKLQLREKVDAARLVT